MKDVVAEPVNLQWHHMTAPFCRRLARFRALASQLASTGPSQNGQHFWDAQDGLDQALSDRKSRNRSDWCPTRLTSGTNPLYAFTSPLFKLFSNEKKEAGISIRGYVDDGFLTVRHKSIQTSVSRIALTFKKGEQWAYDNRIVFDPAKFEAIHFSWKRNLFNLNIELSIPPFAQDPMVTQIVKPTPKDFSIR